MRTLNSLLLTLLLLTAPAAVFAQIQGDVRFFAEQEDAGWVGQEVQLNLELWSDGFSFGEQQYVVPEVRGGYLLQADSSTVKLSENRAGTQWQGLRYTLLFYPQRAGQLQVPAFDVRFVARAAYGTEPASFEFRTDPLLIEARLPPGVDSSGLLVSSTSFGMEASWSPQRPDDGLLSLKVGDALTLEIKRQAQEVPGMVFPPLPEFDITGLGVYPGAPEVNDTINRGLLSGARTDSVTFICETEGTYEIPEMRFQWWDPEQEVLSEKVIPALEIRVEANPVYANTSASNAKGAGLLKDWQRRGMGLLVLVVAWLLIWYPGRSLFRRIMAYREQQILKLKAGELWAFIEVLDTCKQGSPAQAYNAIALWLSRLDGPGDRVSLSQIAEASGNTALAGEAERLQKSMLPGSAGEWSGRELAQLLEKYRVESKRVADQVHVLSPLNPG